MFSEITSIEDTRPEIDRTLDETINQVWKSELSKEKRKRYHEKKTSNFLYLKVSMMDSEIYHHISKPSKTHDVKLQKHQKNIVKSSAAVVEILNILIVIKSNENYLRKLSQNLSKKSLTPQ